MRRASPVLISGAGVGGLVAAYWLARCGYRPLVVERASVLRAQGHAVDLWGSAVDIVGLMGIADQLAAAATDNRTGTTMTRGRRSAALSLDRLSADIHNRHVEVMRSDLVALLAEACGTAVDYRFGEQIDAILPCDDGCDVTLSSGESFRVQAVIGADGLNSRVRAIAFGPETSFVRPLDARLASWTMPNTLGLSHEIVRYLAPGRTIAAYPVRDGGKLAVIAIYRSREASAKVDAWRSEVAARYAGDDGPVPQLLAGLAESEDGFADMIGAVQMPVLARGRVALIGDAGLAPGAALGGGTGLAVLSAYLLAKKIQCAGIVQGLTAYGETMRPLADAAARIGPAMVKTIIPRSRLAVYASLCATSILACLPRKLCRHIPVLPRDARRGLRAIAHFPVPEFPFTSKEAL